MARTLYFASSKKRFPRTLVPLTGPSLSPANCGLCSHQSVHFSGRVSVLSWSVRLHHQSWREKKKATKPSIANDVCASLCRFTTQCARQSCFSQAAHETQRRVCGPPIASREQCSSPCLKRVRQHPTEFHHHQKITSQKATKDTNRTPLQKKQQQHPPHTCACPTT